jgi:hypothetical protein
MPIWVLKPYVYGFRTQAWVLWDSPECEVFFKKKKPLEAGRNPSQLQSQGQRNASDLKVAVPAPGGTPSGNPMFTSLLGGVPPGKLNQIVGSNIYIPACWEGFLLASQLLNQLVGRNPF